MEIVVKVIIVLTVATVADPSSSKPAQNGRKLHVKDHRTFKCNHKRSNEPVFSENVPHVPLTHTFCGEIKDKKAQGFHSRHLIDIHSEECQFSARTFGSITCNSTTCPKCPFSAEGIKLKNKQGNCTYREANKERPQTFFPDDWDPPFIVELVQGIYNHCKCDSIQTGKACLVDYKFPNSTVCPKKTINIMINIRKGNIISAYPVAEINKCDRTYTPAAKCEDLQQKKRSDL